MSILDEPWGMAPGRGEGRINPGTRVRKFTGDYDFPGFAVALFHTSKGKPRVVVECTAPGVEGCLHIFSPEQLEVLP